MPKIQQLESHVADLIAAGEVVERPASVVKELVENAMDAGASVIVVEIQRGGMGLIRVTDNGCGIPAEELPTAFLRHATSKLRTEADLASIGTLGFRGEALAAITSVSHTEILSRPAGAAAGARLKLDGGVPGQVTEAGAPEGTTIQVRDLFYNTPARLKFMKKDSAETAAVNGLMQHLALSHPKISFKFIKDGVEGLHTPGDGKLLSAIYATLGRDFARGLMPIEGRGGEVQVTGFVTQPLMGRGSRSMQTFFVNGRYIKSQLLTAALEESYRNQLMKGKFPGCVLFVDLPVTAVDVNVHPAKTQVKFAREHDVFDAVYYTVLDALKQDRVPEKNTPAASQVVNPRQDFYQNMDAKTYREKVAGSIPATKPAQSAPVTPARPAAPAWNTEWKSVGKVADSVPHVPYAARPAVPQGTPAIHQAPVSPIPRAKEAAPSEKEAPKAPERPFVPAIAPETVEQIQLPVQETITPVEEAPWRIAGEILHTYIVCEDEHENVWLIDKHAAHERVNFDRMQAAQEPPMHQTLLQPVAAELGREDAALILENLPLMERFGFSCEEFGDGTVLVREIPADLDAEDVPALLEEMAEDLRTGRSLSERRENLLHTMACKAAIKGGWTSDISELKVLVEKVQSGEIKYCPHGRPIAVKVTKYQLEKMFKRIV